MKRAARVVAIAAAVIAVPVLTAAQSKADDEARCTAYASRAVAQYNEAVAHPQCAIKVDLVWQPSQEFHFKACMSTPHALSEAQTAARDRLLQGCASSPAVPPAAAAMPLPAEIKQCERSILKVCGTWTLSGQQYVAAWAGGAKATLTVTRFDGHSIALHRVDTSASSNAGMTADYLGEVTGGTMKGKVTYTWPGHVPPVGYGTWDGTFTPAPAPSAEPAPAPSPAPAAAPAPAPSLAGAAGAAAGECPMPAVPATWLDPSYATPGGQMWKLDNGVLSYFDLRDRKQVSYHVTRPRLWQRWVACAPPLVVTTMDVSGWWIWISDDRREAKVFDVTKGNLMMLPVRTVPVGLVLAEEAGKP